MVRLRSPQVLRLLGIYLLGLVPMSYSQIQATDKPKEFLTKEFPMTVGSQWTYLRTDTLIRSIGRKDPIYVTEMETVTVKITKTNKKKQKEIISEWIRTFNTEVDTQNVILKKDTLEFMTPSNPAGSYFTFKIAFPLKAGNRWFGRYGEPPPDSYKVVQPESLEVEAGTFADTYLIERGIWIPNNSIYFKYWVVPNIGIIKIHKWDQYFGEYQTEDWELIRYDIRK